MGWVVACKWLVKLILADTRESKHNKACLNDEWLDSILIGKTTVDFNVKYNDHQDASVSKSVDYSDWLDCRFSPGYSWFGDRGVSCESYWEYYEPISSSGGTLATMDLCSTRQITTLRLLNDGQTQQKKSRLNRRKSPFCSNRRKKN